MNAKYFVIVLTLFGLNQALNDNIVCEQNEGDRNCQNDEKHAKELNISYSNYGKLDSLKLNSKTLEKINVSHNRIVEIPKNFFKNTPNLIEIDFPYNSLNITDSDIFKWTNKLIKIDLSNNQLKSILNEAFVNLTHLKFLDLRNNRIQTPYNFL